MTKGVTAYKMTVTNPLGPPGQRPSPQSYHGLSQVPNYQTAPQAVPAEDGGPVEVRGQSGEPQDTPEVHLGKGGRASRPRLLQTTHD